MRSQRDLRVAAIAAVLVVPVFTAGVALVLRATEFAGDGLAKIGPLETRPTMVRALLVVLAAAAVAVGWRAWRVAGRRSRWAAFLTSSSDDTPAGDVGAPGQLTADGWSPRSQALTVLTAAAAAVGLVHWPNLSRLSTHIIGIGDSEQHVGLAVLVREEMSWTNPIPGRLQGIVHPDGLDAQLLDGYGSIWLAAVLGLVMGPVLAYNASLIVATAANTAAGWLLAGRFTAHPGVRFVAALAFGSAPNVAVRAHAGHMNLTWLFTVALLAWYVLGLGRRAPSPWRLGALLALAFLGSGYFLVIGGLLVVVTLAWSRPDDPAESVRQVALGIGVAMLLLAPWVSSRVQFTVDAASGPDAEVVDEALRSAKRVFVADGASLGAAVPNERFVTVPFSDIRRERLALTVEGWSNPGWVLLAGLAAAVVVGSRRGWLLTSSVVLFVLALGPVPRLFGQQLTVGPTDMGWLPYSVFDGLPVLDGLRVPGRFSMGLAVLGVVGVAMIGEFMRRRVQARTLWVWCVVAGLAAVVTNPREVHAFESIVSPVDAAAFDEVDDRRVAGDAMLVVPNDCIGFEVRYAMLAEYTDVPLVGCHAPHLTLPLASGMPHYRTDEMRSLRCVPVTFAFAVDQWADPGLSSAEVAEGLRDALDVRFVVVHNAALATATCQPIRGRLDQMVGDGVLTRVGNPGQLEIYEIAP